MECKTILLKDLFDDKELMLDLCDCDRHEDVHLDGCKYLGFKERYKKRFV